MSANSDFIVVTRSSDRNRSKLFENTAERFGLPLVILTGKEEFNDLSGYADGIRAVESFDVPYVVITDAFDVLVARWDPSELSSLIETATGQVIISGEPECWPNGPWRKNYPEETDTPWPYACGGQYCGTRESVLKLMREIYDRRGEVTASGASQELMHIMVGENRPMQIDSKCQVFQCIRTDKGALVIPSERDRQQLPYNTVTGSWPMFLHFNAQDQRIKEWSQILE